MRLVAGDRAFEVITTTAHVATVIGPVVSDRAGRHDDRGPDELTATLHLAGLSLAEVTKLQGRTVAIFLAEEVA